MLTKSQQDRESLCNSELANRIRIKIYTIHHTTEINEENAEKRKKK